MRETPLYVNNLKNTSIHSHWVSVNTYLESAGWAKNALTIKPVTKYQMLLGQVLSRCEQVRS